MVVDGEAGGHFSTKYVASAGLAGTGETDLKTQHIRSNSCAGDCRISNIRREKEQQADGPAYAQHQLGRRLDTDLPGCGADRIEGLELVCSAGAMNRTLRIDLLQGHWAARNGSSQRCNWQGHVGLYQLP